MKTCKRCGVKFTPFDGGNICKSCWRVMVGKFLKQRKRK
jgi:hypothetical protein